MSADFVSSKEGEACRPHEIAEVRAGRCPDCGAVLRQGPHGGLSVNWYCTGPVCGSGFNVMPVFGIDRITDAMPKRRKV